MLTIQKQIKGSGKLGDVELRSNQRCLGPEANFPRPRIHVAQGNLNGFEAKIARTTCTCCGLALGGTSLVLASYYEWPSFATQERRSQRIISRSLSSCCSQHGI